MTAALTRGRVARVTLRMASTMRSPDMRTLRLAVSCLLAAACASKPAPPTHFGPWGLSYPLGETDRAVVIAAVAAATTGETDRVVLARYAGGVDRRIDLASLDHQVPVPVDAGGRLGTIDWGPAAVPDPRLRLLLSGQDDDPRAVRPGRARRVGDDHGVALGRARVEVRPAGEIRAAPLPSRRRALDPRRRAGRLQSPPAPDELSVTPILSLRLF